MALETPTGIWDLNPLYPTSTDDIGDGDDHIRNIKSSLQLTYPGVSATVNATTLELNYLSGLTENVQDGFDRQVAHLAYGDMRLTNSSSEFSASTSLSIFTGFITPGLSSLTTLLTASGAISVAAAGDYEISTNFSISASSAAEVTIAIYVNDTDSNIHASGLVPAQGRGNMSCGGYVTMVASDEARIRLKATVAKLITVKDAQVRVRKLT